jgi:hypothetical protein
VGIDDRMASGRRPWLNGICADRTVVLLNVYSVRRKVGREGKRIYVDCTDGWMGTII